MKIEKIIEWFRSKYYLFGWTYPINAQSEKTGNISYWTTKIKPTKKEMDESPHYPAYLLNYLVQIKFWLPKSSLLQRLKNERFQQRKFKNGVWLGGN